MSSPAEPTPAVARCAECGARVRPDDRWCTLCLTPVAVPGLLREPAARLAGEPAPVADEPVDDEPVDDDLGPELSERDKQVAAAIAERLMAELNAEESHRLPPRLAAIRPRTKAAEALLACSGGLVMVGLLFGALYVVGRFL
jgi:hypothetical protein